MTAVNQPDCDSFAGLIQARTGLKFDAMRCTDLLRALRATPPNDSGTPPAQIHDQLAAQSLSSPLWQSALQVVAIGETYFWRNEAHFNALRDHVLPGLIARQRQYNLPQLRIWSAGCATGEEPYSIAMLLHDLLPDIASWHITLLATDINQANFERAQRGLYGKNAFRGETPADLPQRWFTKKGDSYEIHPAIRRAVTFAPLNLQDNTYPSFESGTMNMDLILCRNVTIYFEPETTEQIINRFYDALSPDGWLILGHSETMSVRHSHLQPRNFEHAVFHQKVAPAPAPLWLQAQPAREQRESITTLAVVAPKRLPRIAPDIPLTPAIPPPSQAANPPAPPPEVALWLRAKEAADREAWPSALDLLAEAERVNPLQPQIHYLRALILLQTGSAEKALSALRQTLYCDSTFALAHYMMGELFAQQDDYHQARRCWQMARTALTDAPADGFLLFSDDLTVEMLRGLLQHRLNTIP